MRIEHGAGILVTDGRRRILLRNVGDADYPNLVTLTRAENPRPTEQVTTADAPGRAFASAVAPVRSAVSEPDLHRDENAFARDTALDLDIHVRAGEFGTLIVAADPHTLGELRRHYSKPVQKLLTGEVNKDLVRHPVAEIERIILSS